MEKSLFKETAIYVLKWFMVLIIAIVFLLYYRYGINETSETTTITATVLDCRIKKTSGSSALGVLSTTSMGSGDYSNANLYSAAEHATQKNSHYKITVNIDGKDYIVIRDTPYELGNEINITKVITYDNNGNIFSIKYE